jgi:6,7-dimethyl-8-ribityllumazine synthase
MASGGRADYTGETSAADFRFGIVVSRFNEVITDGLLRGALAALRDSGARNENIAVVRVPGAFELPLAAQRLAQRRAESGGCDAVIALGCLIKGDTMHFEYIASAVSHGIMDVSLSTGVPVAFGVLTTLTDEQARARAADDLDNKGREAALAAIEMASLIRQTAEPRRIVGLRQTSSPAPAATDKPSAT